MLDLSKITALDNLKPNNDRIFSDESSGDTGVLNPAFARTTDVVDVPSDETTSAIVVDSRLQRLVAGRPA